jgi:ferredoxin--NADP+ reductase
MTEGPAPAGMAHEALNATLVQRRDLSAGYAILRLRPDALPIPRFTPGQFIAVGLPLSAPGARERLTQRPYSIASGADDRGGYELFVALVEQGRLTPALWALGPGGRLWVAPRALGLFTLERVPLGKDLVFVATGTGVAPYVSMLRSHRERPPWRRAVLFHGVRRASDFGYRDELAERELADPAFRYFPIASREAEGWSGIRGRVQPLFERERFAELVGWPLDPEHCHVFLCGNPEMIESLRASLARLGFERGIAPAGGNLHFERYW